METNPPSVTISDNYTTSDPMQPLDKDDTISVHLATYILCTSLLFIVIIVGCYGNGVVLISAMRSRKQRTDFDGLIINLSVADMLVCFIVAPLQLFLLYYIMVDSRALCLTSLFISQMCSSTSVFTLDAIAIHRQIRVVRHLKSNPYSRKVTITALLLWTLAAILTGGATAYAFRNWPQSANTCSPIFQGRTGDNLNVILFFLAPVCLISFFIVISSYLVIACAVLKQSKIKMTPPSNLPTPHASPSKVVPNAEEENPNSNYNTQVTLDKESKALGMCALVTLILLLCWGPLTIAQLTEVWIGSTTVSSQVKIIGCILVTLNSALNPFIYAPHDSQIRQNYSIISRYFQRNCAFCCCCYCCCCRVCKRQHNSAQGETRLQAVGGGTVEENRNKSSHNDTNNSRQMVPIRAPRTGSHVDRAVGPSYSMGARPFTSGSFDTNSDPWMKGHTVYTVPLRQSAQLFMTCGPVSFARHSSYRIHSMSRNSFSVAEQEEFVASSS